ncbi:hypothetical protein [Chishuiella changwenlii]|uniref:hypothetical protein n=1 Tax=Chishuiella changwenlii TaxID=1434701 RepID=UPI002FDB4934
MKHFTGTIDDFMIVYDEYIDLLILDRINQDITLHHNSLQGNYDESSMKEKLIELKLYLRMNLLREFEDWEIAIDTESFKHGFNQIINGSKVNFS